MTENYYSRYLELIEIYPDERDPIIITWLTKHMKEVLRDAVNYAPPQIYKYMLTFTIDPKKVSTSKLTSNCFPDVLQDQIESYICRLLKDKRFTKVYYVKEHALTNCHWHVVVYSHSCFKHDIIKYYKKQYGNVDVSRSHDTSDEHTQKYLSKEPGAEIKQIL